MSTGSASTATAAACSSYATLQKEGCVSSLFRQMDATPMKQVEWISQFRGLWIGKLDALVTEATQGKKSSKARTGHGS